jgi:hypothetical protein
MINPTLANEFAEIVETQFWKAYIEAIMKARDAAATQLCKNSRISEPVVRGDIWQGNLQVIDQILTAPSRIIGKEDEE